MKEHLVVDTAAFIKLKQLEQFGYTNVHVVPAVAAEIRDETARRHLEFALVLPKISMPEELDLVFVRNFAAQTGDLGFLSPADLQVIALTYRLQRQTGNFSTLRTSPEMKVEIVAEIAEEENVFWGVAAEDDDDEGWIGQDNIEECRNANVEKEPEAEVEEDHARVACLTTDFSIQNVLLHMGLSVVAVDGMRVVKTKTWGLLCRACKKPVLDTTKQFCPSCGNNGMRRVPLTINANGITEVHAVPQQFRNLRGKIYPIPKPKGGRKGDLILCEDQLFIGGRDRLLRRQLKLQQKEKWEKNPFNPDIPYEQRGWWTTGSSQTGITTAQIGLGPGNPNSNRWRKRHTRK